MTLLLALTSLAAAASEGATVNTLPANMPALTVVNDYGDVTVRYDPTARQSTLSTTPQRWDEGCELRLSGTMSAAKAQIERPEKAIAPRCRTDIELILAGDTELTLQVGHGTVLLEDLGGATQVDLRSGELWLNHTRGPVAAAVGRGKVLGTPLHDQTIAHVSVGRIDLEELEVGVTASVGLGGVRLAHDIAVNGPVSAEATVGRVVTLFPYGVYVDSDEMDAGLGRTVREIPHRNASNTEIVADSKVGSVKLKTIVDHEAPQAMADSD